MEFHTLLTPADVTTQSQHIRISGAFSTHEPSTSKHRFSVQVMPSADASAPTTDAEAVQINELLYLRFQRLPKFPLFKTDAVEKQWMQINTQQPPAFLQTLGLLPKATTQSQDSTSFAALFLKHPFLRLEPHTGSTTVEGVEVNSTPVAFDAAVFDQFQEQFETTIRARFGSGTYTDSLLQLVNGIQDISGEAWIGVYDHLPYRVDLSITHATGRNTLHADFSKFNQALAINAPSSFVAPDDILDLLLGKKKLRTALPEKANDARLSNPALDVDDDGLTNGEEERMLTDPSNPDSDGDGYLDGEEVDAGYNPMGSGTL